MKKKETFLAASRRTVPVFFYVYVAVPLLNENDMIQARLHHEIYLTDARKVPPEKWKTVIRHPIRKIQEI